MPTTDSDLPGTGTNGTAGADRWQLVCENSEEYVDLVFAAFICVLSVLTVSANGFIVHKLVIKLRAEKDSSRAIGYYMLSLSLSDLLLGAAAMPLCILYQLTDSGFRQSPLFSFWLVIDYGLPVISIFNILLLNLDRCFSVVHPLYRRTSVSNKKPLIAVLAVWMLPTLFVLVAFAVGRNRFRAKSEFVDFEEDVRWIMVTFALFYFIPFALMIATYVLIIVKLERSSNLFRKSTGSAATESATARLELSSRKASELGYVLSRADIKRLRKIYQIGQRNKRRFSSHTSTSSATAATNGLVENSQQTFQPEEEAEVTQQGSERNHYCDGPKESFEPVICQTEIISELSEQLEPVVCKRKRSKSVSNFDDQDLRAAGRKTTRRHSAVASFGIKVRSSIISLGDRVYKHKKVVRQLAVMSIFFVLCLLPYYSYILVLCVCPTCLNCTFLKISIVFGYSGSLFNPCLYSLYYSKKYRIATWNVV